MSKTVRIYVVDWKAQPGYRAGDDADSFIRREGPEAFQRMVDEAKPAFEMIVKDAWERFGDAPDLYRRTEIIEQMLDRLISAPPVIRREYIRIFGAYFEFEEDEVVKLIADTLAVAKHEGRMVEKRQPAPPTKQSSERPEAHALRERFK